MLIYDNVYDLKNVILNLQRRMRLCVFLYFIFSLFKYAHFNNLPVKFSVCVNEGQANFLQCISYLSFTKDRTKLDLLQIQTLVLLLNFLNYFLSYCYRISCHKTL